MLLSVELYSANASLIDVAVIRVLANAPRPATALGARRDQVRDAECDQRGHPVDGLGDARRLVQIETSCVADELGGCSISAVVAPGTVRRTIAAARAGSG